QRFFRIQIVSEQHYHSLIMLIPEDRAPDSLVELWRDGEGCVSDKD
ncbi:protealysin inhibitor emfourin, partial [Klebsiella michiganensis]